LALTHGEAGKLPEALRALSIALALSPALPVAHHNRGKILYDRGHYVAAAGAYRRAIVLRPVAAESHWTLGAALAALGRNRLASRQLHRALALHPASVDALQNLGVIAARGDDLDRAEGRYGRALAVDPAHAVTLFNWALARLARGDWATGFDAYEARWQLPGRARPSASIPRWSGQRLHGQTIVVEAEQGFGDTIQFVRYVPCLRHRSAKSLLRVQPELFRLMQSLRDIDGVVGEADVQADFSIPLLSLPRLLQASPSTIPRDMPYLQARSDLSLRWARRLKDMPGYRVGLVWQGLTHDPFLADRSVEFEVLQPLLAVAGCRFVSLQRDGGRADLQRSAVPIADLGAELVDFADTAALVSQLDLVISIDTATAHLAGALAVPVWMLLKAGADWRWAPHEDRTPWYPSARLFRQRHYGDWREVIARAAAELAREVHSLSA
jgi:hypothetical protein